MIVSQKSIAYLTVLLCLGWLASGQQKEYYFPWYNAQELSSRMLVLMRTYIEEGSKKIAAINPIRFMHEVTPQYETGYLMGEIIERYRKMVEHNKRSATFRSDSVFDTLKRTEQIQMLYFEIYHLVNMLHEVPRKYGYNEHMLLTNKSAVLDNSLVEEANKRIAENERRRAKERKQRIKEQKKVRELFIKGQLDKMPQKDRRPKNRWWPIDYGWEIDYNWRR